MTASLRVRSLPRRDNLAVALPSRDEGASSAGQGWAGERRTAAQGRHVNACRANLTRSRQDKPSPWLVATASRRRPLPGPFRLPDGPASPRRADTLLVACSSMSGDNTAGKTMTGEGPRGR